MLRSVSDSFRTLLRLRGALFRHFWGPAPGYSFRTLFGLFRGSGPEGPGRPCGGRGRSQTLWKFHELSVRIFSMVWALSECSFFLVVPFCCSILCNSSFRVPQKEVGKRSSITFLFSSASFGHFLVTFSDASVTRFSSLFFTLPVLQKHFVNIFFVFAREFCIENRRGFLVNFFWSPFPTKRSTKTPRKIRGKFGAEFGAKFRTKIRKIRGTFGLQLF